jgi:arsenite methyltransferase
MLSAEQAAPASSGTCCGGPAPVAESSFHGDLAALLRKYDVNDYAASVKVFAVKPR